MLPPGGAGPPLRVRHGGEGKGLVQGVPVVVEDPRTGDTLAEVRPVLGAVKIDLPVGNFKPSGVLIYQVFDIGEGPKLPVSVLDLPTELPKPSLPPHHACQTVVTVDGVLNGAIVDVSVDGGRRSRAGPPHRLLAPVGYSCEFSPSFRRTVG